MKTLICYNHAKDVTVISQSGATVTPMQQLHWVCVKLACVTVVTKTVGVAGKLKEKLKNSMVVAVGVVLILAVVQNGISLNTLLTIQLLGVCVHDVRPLSSQLERRLWYLSSWQLWAAPGSSG